MSDLILRSMIAFPMGVVICFRDLKRFCIIPFLIGLIAYFLCLFICFQYFSDAVSYFQSQNDSYFAIALNYLSRVLVTILILFFSSFISMIIVLIFNSVNSSNIAYEVLKLENADLPILPNSYFKESIRVILVELQKFVIFLPFYILSLILAVSGLFTILGFFLAAFLLMFQFVDIILDLYQLPIRKRVSFIFSNIVYLISFGIILNILFIIPFLGILIAPIAVASAAWLVSGTKMQLAIKELKNI